MSVHIFNGAHRTFRLEAGDGTYMIVPPLAFADIPEKFTGDITYRMAVKAGDIQSFETVKQGDKLGKAAHETKPATTAATPAKATSAKGGRK